jgi:hypothetical protein
MLISILIIFFLVLILYQIFLAIFGKSVEGMENGDTYADYDMNNSSNALILAQQNAGNISYLKERIDELMDLNGTVMDICGNIVQINEQMQGLVQQQADAAIQLAGDTPVVVDGATE